MHDKSYSIYMSKQTLSYEHFIIEDKFFLVKDICYGNIMCGFFFKASHLIHMFSSMFKRSNPFSKEHKMINESSLWFFNFLKSVVLQKN
jgi:hypothetical protein